MNENITNATEEVLEVVEEIATTDLQRKSFGKKATIGVLAIAALSCAAKFGYDYYKKTKNAKAVDTIDDEEAFEDAENFEDTTE